MTFYVKKTLQSFSTNLKNLVYFIVSHVSNYITLFCSDETVVTFSLHSFHFKTQQHLCKSRHQH